MVAMLVGDEDGVDRGRVLSAQQQAPQKLLAGETGVHQQPCAGAGDDRAVASASTRQHRDRHRHNREHNLNPESAVVTKWLTGQLSVASSQLSEAVASIRL